uniref:Apple domain-containing protein n=1 Tax=Ditylenchus dipsaci TaxID=166011 RepID=A0A915DPJ4_9BILA
MLAAHLYCILFYIVGDNISMEAEQLKPCFERYDGHKLFDATPFHSEWRMKTEEQCLPFCVKTSSRCASIVYDKMNHICHYFTVNGIEFELLEKNPRWYTCKWQSEDDMMSAMDADEKSVSEQKPLVSQSAAPNKTASDNHDVQPLTDSPLLPNTDLQTPTVETELEVVEPVAASTTQTFPSQTVESQPFGEETSTTFGDFDAGKTFEEYTPESTVEAAVNRDIATHSDPQIINQKEEDPEEIPTIQPTTSTTYTPVMETIDPEAAPAFLPVMNVFKASSRVKQASVEQSEDNHVRRHPVSSPPFDAKPPRVQHNNQHNWEQGSAAQASKLPTSVDANIGQAVENEACQGDTNQFGWRRNSKINSQMNDSMQNYLSRRATEPRECINLCKGMDIPERYQKCDSFTYFEKEKRCILDSVADSFTRNSLAIADKMDFSTRAFHKFCYPANMSPFVDCSEFLAFRDYSLQMTPREIFDGLPTGRDGLCLSELCVSLMSLDVEDYLGATVQRVVKPSLANHPATVQPVRIDFKKFCE